MKFSYQQLQNHFSEPLPRPEALQEVITQYAFEVEEVVEKEGEVELEIKVLPDRAADAKNPLGMAREIAAITGLSLKPEFVVAEAGQPVPFDQETINNILGLELKEEEMVALLARERIVVKGKMASAPAERKDLVIIEDLADEIGRLYGVGKIPPQPLAPWPRAPLAPLIRKADKVRELLIAAGYTEVFGYSLTDHGEREIEKSVASDKNFLRTNLAEGLEKAIRFNVAQTLFEHEAVKLFEIGTVFVGGQEEIRVAVGIGYRSAKYQKESLPDLALSWKGWAIKTGDVIEIKETKLEDVVEASAEPNLKPFIHLDTVFKPIPAYPRVIRDLALWVPEGVGEETVIDVIKTTAGCLSPKPEAGVRPLLFAGPVKFDEFHKDGRVSLAFRLVFQSYEKTLSDAEVNVEMEKVVVALEKKGWEVRK